MRRKQRAQWRPGRRPGANTASAAIADQYRRTAARTVGQPAVMADQQRMIASQIRADAEAVAREFEAIAASCDDAMHAATIRENAALVRRHPEGMAQLLEEVAGDIDDDPAAVAMTLRYMAARRITTWEGQHGHRDGA